ncbi:HEAT repeat domain-containing protein [Methanoregula sp.]|uniref:HEAT repeat domain-containing protein n=1 Tax=Methanoregula sp. TaxID=2052170 RepID=UPI002375523D|nr:HEAT repeat domain-containing protein [Methanoregula sp.]MDD1686309.1 HEAT repeat domain-containing protein [Methanoregula sp.]
MFDQTIPFGIRRTDIDSGTEKLVRALEGSIGERRQDIITGLAETGTTILPCILRAFEDPGKKDLMAAAGEVLVLWGDPVFSLLAEFFENTDPATRAAAAGAWGYLGKPAGPYLVTALNDPSRDVRYRAALALTQIGWVFPPEQIREEVTCAVLLGETKGLIRKKKAAVPVLLDLLDDEDYRMKAGAIKGLGEIKSVKALPRLAPLIRSNEIEVRSAVVEALGKIGNTRIIPVLVHALGDSTPYVRIEAVWALEKLGWKPENNQQMVRLLIAKEQWEKLSQLPAEAIPALVPALLDANPSIRNKVTAILVSQGKAAVPALIQAQKSSHDPLKNAATEVLAQIQTSAGTRSISPVLKGISNHSWLLSDEAIPEDQKLTVTFDDPEEDLEQKIAEPLEEKIRRLSALIRDPDPAIRVVAVEELRATGLPGFNPLHTAVQDPDTGVRSAAAEALGAIKSVRALPSLIRLLRTDPETVVRIASARALGVIQDAYAIPPLIEQLSHPDDGVRSAAASALGTIGSPALPAILTKTRDRNTRIRAAAIRSLGAMKDPVVIPYIIRGFTEQDPGVRTHAALALDAVAKTIPQRFLEIIPGLILAGSTAERGGILDTLATMENEQVLWIACAVRDDPDPIVQKKALDIIRKWQPDLLAGPKKGALQPRDEHTLRILVGQLSDRNPAIRKTAEDQLKETGQPAVLILLSALRDSPTAVCGIITGIIASMQASVVGDLIDAIHDESPVVREVAVTLLGPCPEERAIHAIGWVLYGETEPDIRKIAAVSLGKTGNKSSIQPLVNSLADIPEVSRAAIEALGTIGGDDACNALITFLETAPDDAIPGVAQALARCGEPARDALFLALMKKGPAFRRNVVAVLDHLSWQPEDMPGRIRYLVAKGDWDTLLAMGLPALQCLIASFDDEVKENRLEVARIIGHLGEPARIPVVRALSDDRAFVREGAVLTLGFLGKSSEKNIAGRLRDPDALVRYAAAQSLDRIQWVPQGEGPAALYDVAKRDWGHVVVHKKTAGPALVRVLGDLDFEVQSGTIRTLGILGDLRAVPYLILLAKKTEDIRIIQAAISALGHLACPEVQQFLLESLSHPVFAVRTLAAVSLEKTGWTARDTAEKVQVFIALQNSGALATMGPAIIPLLVRALDDDQVLGRLVITEALISMGEPAIAGLTDIIHGDDKHLMGTARNMLALLKKREPPRDGTDRYDTCTPYGASGAISPAEIKKRLEQIRELLAGADESTKLNAVALLQPLGQPAVNDLTALVRDENPAVTIAALHALGRINAPEALPVMISLVGDPNPDIRRAVAESLGCFRDASVIPSLVRCFMDPSASVRSEAIRALSGMGSFAMRPVLEATEDREPQIRSAALETLGKFPDPVVLHPLVKSLTDPDEHVRFTSAKVLGSLVARPDSLVIDVLTKIQTEGDPETRLVSLDVLLFTDDVRALDLLDLLTHDENEQISAKARELVARKENEAQQASMSGEPATVPAEKDISRCIHDLANKNPKVRKGAATILRGFGEPAVIPLLHAYARSDPEVQAVIAGVLESMGGSLVDELDGALDHIDASVRIAAACVLVKIHDPRSVQILGHALYGASDPKTRQAIAESIGLLGDRRGAKALADILGDPSRDVNLAAIRSLVMLRDAIAIRPLIGQLYNPDEDSVLAATDSLRQLGEPARADMVNLLCKGDHARKAIAAGILEDLNCVPQDPVERAYFLIGKEQWYAFEEIGEKALGPLGESLGDNDVHIRLGVITAIAKIGGTGAIRPLIFALNDPSPIVRHRTENFLVNIGAPVVEALTNALDHGDIHAPSQAGKILLKIEQAKHSPQEDRAPELPPEHNPEDNPGDIPPTGE